MRGYESKKSALQISGRTSNGTIKQNLSKENRLARRTAKKQMTAEEYIVNTLESIGYKVISTELREM